MNNSSPAAHRRCQAWRDERTVTTPRGYDERTRSYDVELVSTIEALAALEPEWMALARRARGATVFQTPAWILPWWTQFGEGSIATPAVRHDGVLVGLAPAYVRLDGEGALIGSGNTDYVEALCDASCTRESACHIVQRLAEVPCAKWVLQPLDERSPLTSATSPDCLTRISPLDVYPRLQLPDDVSRLDAAIPHHHLAKLRRARHALDRAGGVTLLAGDLHNSDELLDTLERLHAARWNSRGAPGVFTDARVQAFHRDVARAMARLGALRLYEMRVNGAAVAAFYGFSWNGRTVYYIGGYDPAWSKYSVGSLVILQAIEEAVRCGDREFDFLRGGESYKYAWGAQPATGVTLELWRADSLSGAA
jgi:CelD/BcsL family acetyltransferase involved in cellulose biosynthesis